MWGRKAAEQGYAPAQMALGRALISSVEQERKDEAIDLLRKAAEAGQADAVIFLATAIGKGEYGLRKDETYAEALLKPWAEKGNADCQFVLAALYKFGDSFPDRRKDAQIWLQRAADQNHSRALEVLKSEEQ
ncbi:MAG: tetratricopeptide repeat protein, partial [Chthoniobacterales bacterium]